MINYVNGVVVAVADTSVIIEVGGFGLSFQVPNSGLFEVGKQQKLFTYMHWSSDNGPSIFGFQAEFERAVFLLIIDCQGIGPKMGINILSQISAQEFVLAVQAEDEKRLSSLNGIGTKKAEQIVVSLRRKVSKISSGDIPQAVAENMGIWNSVSDTLDSLSYSKTEVASAMRFIREKYAGSGCSFDQLLRYSLSFLSK
ncbi:MAG: Holliday junction ATP-dependent DNA helicase RuvA [candidate division TM6 bacterium GW2011_GWF2_32_72]|nr:MAG: Holliday junction ATP-dependent DNA helicase RuvA [candidate division TM6 bacterium GW2011_GWF2_32_72]